MTTRESFGPMTAKAKHAIDRLRIRIAQSERAAERNRSKGNIEGANGHAEYANELRARLAELMSAE